MRALRRLLPALPFLVASLAASAQVLPSPAIPLKCVVTAQQFRSWFQSGSVSANGAVNPANSLNLDTSNNCNFYRWSQQMLLWLTSPAPASYAGSGRVFDSDLFYDVSEPNDLLKRSFVPHRPVAPDAPLAERARALVHLRPGKPGPNGLPAVLDRKGRVVEVLLAEEGPNGRPLVLSGAGTMVEAVTVSVGSDRKAVFHDAAGKVIAKPKLTLPKELEGARVGRRFFTSDGTPIIVGSGGDVLDVSPRQAGSAAAVLLSQSGSVVYYTIVANDVYAYFTSGVNSGKIKATQFPTKQADLDRIQTYAGRKFSDAEALAVEVKLSWVDVSAVRDPGNYITTPALVPVYDTSDPRLWRRRKDEVKLTTLALVGVHIVGSAKGHPEMIWSTFEHVGNSPNGAYQYIDDSGRVVSVPASSGGTWVFSSGTARSFNVVHADYLKQPNIEGARLIGGQFDVSPSDTQRVYPFGVDPNRRPNQEDKTAAASNTQVLSINKSVLANLASGDVRSNYYFIGSTWTFGGFAPTGPFRTNTNPFGAEIGTNRLANSTMETYQQAGPFQSSGSNCFSCHTDGRVKSRTAVTTNVSHIFKHMLPLVGGANNSSTAAPPPKVIHSGPSLTSSSAPATKKPNEGA